MSKLNALILLVLLTIAVANSVAIKKFGRYPHRNIILNRKSSYEEEVFLKQSNSSW